MTIADDEQARGEKASIEELASAKMTYVKAPAETDVDKGLPKNRSVSIFNIFYPYSPATSNSTFIVFILGFLRRGTNAETIRGRGSSERRLGICTPEGQGKGG